MMKKSLFSVVLYKTQTITHGCFSVMLLTVAPSFTRHTRTLTAYSPQTWMVAELGSGFVGHDGGSHSRPDHSVAGLASTRKKPR